MNESEIRRICEILKMADGGCAECVSELFYHFKKAFPWWKKKITEIYEEWVNQYPYKEELEIIKTILEEKENEDLPSRIS